MLLFVFSSLAADQKYQLGAADEIEISVWQHDDLYKEVKVSPDGYISYPFIGYFKVAGMTIDEIQSYIKKKLEEYIIEPEVTVIVKEYKSHKAFILGQVKNPGFVSLAGGERILELVLKQGGFLPTSDLKNIDIIHSNGTKKIVNIEDFILGKDINQNVKISAGDVVYVPELKYMPVSKRAIYLFGAVAKPGLYEYKDGMRVLDLISEAGNPEFSASANSTKIIRGSPDSPQIINVHLKSIIQKGRFDENLPLQPKDIVYVPDNMISNLGKFLNEFSPIFSAINSVYFTKQMLLPSK